MRSLTGHRRRLVIADRISTITDFSYGAHRTSAPAARLKLIDGATQSSL